MSNPWSNPTSYKQVVDMTRVERLGKGKVRPKVTVWYQYHLECGHTVERRKKAGQPVPEHIPCKECQTAAVP